jgi:uncharacterized membrane protein YfhO
MSADQPAIRIGRFAISEGAGTVRALAAENDRLALHAETARGMRVTINSHYFPGWAVRLDGHDVRVAASPGTGFMAVDVPPGVHRVEARFENTPIRTSANTISVVAGILAVVLLATAVRSGV